MINKSVAGNTRLLVIGLGETTINHHEFAARLDGILAATGMNGNVAVDDVTGLTLYAEGIENAVANLLAVAQLEVVALLLLIGLLVAKEIALEGGHL